MKEMMTINTVAKVYNKSYTAVYNAIRSGRLKAKVENGVYLIAPEEAKKWRDSVRCRTVFTSVTMLETLNFKVPKAMFDKLHELAAAKNVSLGEYCRMALNNQIMKEEE